jgi:hypothetical protein
VATDAGVESGAKPKSWFGINRDIHSETVMNSSNIPASGMPLKINLELWFESLKALFAKDKDVCVYDDPADYFDGFYTEMGLPCSPEYRPIWFEDGLVIYVERTGCIFVPEDRCWKSCDENLEYRVFWLSADGVFSEVSQKNGHLHEFFKPAARKRWLLMWGC